MASKWYNPFSWGARDPSIMTKTVVDPLKQAVATPYSKFLEQSISKGLPSYEGDLTPDMGTEARSAYSNFMGIDAGQWWDKNIGAGAKRDFQEDYLPTLEEGYAGALRGSGRYRDVEGNINRFATDLAAEKGQATLDITKAQVETGFKEWEVRQEQAKLEYQDWYKSLPEMNPMLDKALSFLSNTTSSGTDTLSALDSGQEGWFTDLISSIASIATAGTV